MQLLNGIQYDDKDISPDVQPKPTDWPPEPLSQFSTGYASIVRTAAVIVFHFLHCAVRDISDNDVITICLKAAHDTDETERQPLAWYRFPLISSGSGSYDMLYPDDTPV